MASGLGGVGQDALRGEALAPMARVVTIGDELLTGERVDGNARWLARRLTDLGFRVTGLESAGDREEDIGEALSRAVSVADLVVVTGGLGPTLDDRTREGVARQWGLSLDESPALVEEMRARFRARGYHDLPAANRRVARVPQGAQVLPNPEGSSPGLWIELPPGATEPTPVILLPGVPREMEAIMAGAAGSAIAHRFQERLAPARSILVYTTGIPESVLAGRVEALVGDDLDVEVAYRPSLRGVEMRLSARGSGAEERLTRARSLLHDALGSHLYHAPSGNLAEAVGKALESRGLRVAVAESCTGGRVLGRLTDISGSSRWVVGGVVAYSNRIKEEWLKVPPALLEAQGAVSQGVVEEMAQGVRTRMGVEVGLAITGIAGPTGATPGKPVGTVWFGVSGPAGLHSERVRFGGGREEVRERAAQHGLHLILQAVSAP